MTAAQQAIEKVWQHCMNLRDASSKNVPEAVEDAFIKEYRRQYQRRQRIAEFKAAAKLYKAFFK